LCYNLFFIYFFIYLKITFGKQWLKETHF